MGSSFSKRNRSGASESRKLHGNYPTSARRSIPLSPGTARRKTKTFSLNSLNAASNGRCGDLDSKKTPTRDRYYETAYAAPAFSTLCSVKPVLPKSHGTNNTSASLDVSTEGSNSTDRWSRAPATISATTVAVDRESIKGFSVGGTGFDAADVGLKPNKAHAAPVFRSATKKGSTIKNVLPKSHGTNNTSASLDVSTEGRLASTISRNHGGYHEGDGRRLAVFYGAIGGGKVAISVPLNPWEVLGLQSSRVSKEAVKAAFKRKIAQPVRQNRAMVSIAYHMLTSSAARYTQIPGKDEFVVTSWDHFMLAACGHTEALTLRIDKTRNLVKDKDEFGRTLLYIASKSGFYDTCKLLLEKGASIDEAQKDGSTPLHGAAFFGHALVVGLLLQHRAKSDIKNKWGNSALDESATPTIRSLIETASADVILSVASSLKDKQLILNVRLIEYQGEVIAKELTRDPRTLDAHTLAEWNRIHNTWETAWHGTRYKYLESIIQKGLLPAGASGIKPAAGHYSLGEEHFGIANWAAAIFLSPSILYAAHACYSERILSESQQWCVLIKAYCKPGSYKSYDPTVFSYRPMDGEPVMPEYRIPVHEADKNVILRVESTRSVVVRSLMFVRLAFLENQNVNFDQAMELLR